KIGQQRPASAVAQPQPGSTGAEVTAPNHVGRLRPGAGGEGGAVVEFVAVGGNEYGPLGVRPEAEIGNAHGNQEPEPAMARVCLPVSTSLRIRTASPMRE